MLWVQFIGEELNMTKETEKLKQEITDLDIDRSNLFKIVDKLEQRIFKLEKVLQSHAKCIGEIRKICDE